MAVSPLFDSDGAVRLTLLSGGAPVPDTVRVHRVQVRRAVGTIPSALIVVDDGEMPGEWPIADGTTFAPGAAITIRAGYGDNEAVIFSGIVVGLGVRIAADNCSRLQVDCRDAAVTMTEARSSATYRDATDSDVITAAIVRHGLPHSVAATRGTHGELVQYACSDWDFVVARAAANGLQVIVTDGSVAVAAAEASEAALAVSWGIDLLDFSADLDARAAARGVGASPRGRMTFQGSAKALVGGTITVAGVGNRFSGDVFVGGLTHDIADGTWTTAIDFGLPPTSVAERADGAAAPAPSISGAAGLQVGVVVTTDDPAGEQRVAVTLPVLGEASGPIWARLLQPYASDGFGTFFMPEVGDEVVVGYFNDDPSSPVILGSVYSRDRTPPYAPAQANDTKAIVTRSGARIEINDADIVVTVATPANNKVVISDKDKTVTLADETGNTIVTSPSGIALSSPKDISLSAKGAIVLDALGGITVSATADVAVSGLNIVADAKVAFTGKGAASAELSAGGEVTVRGAMVMIN